MDINGNREKQYPILEVRDTACLKVFIAYGPNLDFSNGYGNILQHIAWYDNASLIDYTLSVGIKWIRNESGETPCHTALKGHKDNILDILKKKYPQ